MGTECRHTIPAVRRRFKAHLRAREPCPANRAVKMLRTAESLVTIEFTAGRLCRGAPVPQSRQRRWRYPICRFIQCVATSIPDTRTRWIVKAD
jgi:hypothetical protein